MENQSTATGRLIKAMENGDIASIEMILNQGININEIDPRNGGTALHWAVSMKRIDIIRLLIEHNINLDIRDNGGRTALVLAEELNESEITNLLKQSIISCTAKQQSTNLLNIDKWIEKQVEDSLNTLGKSNTFNTEKIITEIERIKRDKNSKLELEALEKRFFEDNTTDIIVNFEYEGISFQGIYEVDPLVDEILIDESNEEIQEVINELVDRDIEDKNLSRDDLTDDELEEIRDRIEGEHLNTIIQEVQDRISESIKNNYSDLCYELDEIEPDILEVILKNANYADLELTQSQLESILYLASEENNQREESPDNPVYGFLDTLINGLQHHFNNISIELYSKYGAQLKNAIMANIEASKELQELKSRFKNSQDNKDELDQHRVLIVFAQAVHKVISSVIKVAQEKYVTGYNDFQTIIVIDKESIKKVIPTAHPIPSQPINLDEYHEWISQAENFYKVFIEHGSANCITYISNRNPESKTATHNLIPIFAAMRKKGKESHTIFTKHVYTLKCEELTAEIDEKKGLLEQHRNSINNISSELESPEKNKRLKKLNKQHERDLKKIATLTQEINKLETSRREIENLLISDSLSLANTTNLIVPTLLFCVSSSPHAKNGTHSRKFFKVDIKLEELPYLISSDEEDKIFHDHKTQVELVKIEEERFFSAIGSRQDIYTWRSSRTLEVGTHKNLDILLERYKVITGHSERVLMQALKTKSVIGFIVEQLRIEMEKKGHTFDKEQPPYKVYGVAVLAHSTQIVCHNCVRAFIAQQTSHEENSFLHILTKELNEHSEGSFKAYKKGEIDDNGKERQGLKCASIIVSDRPYAKEEQSELVKRHPTTKISFEHNSVELKNINPLCMIELFNPDLPEPDDKTWVSSNTYLSGSLGGDKLVTRSEKSKYPEVKNGIILPHIRDRKAKLSSELKDQFSRKEELESKELSIIPAEIVEGSISYGSELMSGSPRKPLDKKPFKEKELERRNLQDIESKESYFKRSK